MWTGPALASAGPDWKYFCGVSLSCVFKNFLGENQAIMIGVSDVRKVYPKGWRQHMDDLPFYHSTVLFFGLAETVLSFLLQAKILLDCGRCYLDQITPNIPIHDSWPSDWVVCPPNGSGKVWIFVLVRLVRCSSRRTCLYVRHWDTTLSKWPTSLLVLKRPLWLSGIASSVRLLTLSQFSLWCGSSKAFSSYSELALLKCLSNALFSFSTSAFFALVLNSPPLTATQCFWPKSMPWVKCQVT